MALPRFGGHHRAAAAIKAKIPEVPTKVTNVTMEQGQKLEQRAADATAERSFKEK